MQESYALVHTEVSRRIVVIMSPMHAAVVLTKAFHASTDRDCLTCALFYGEVETSGGL